MPNPESNFLNLFLALGVVLIILSKFFVIKYIYDRIRFSRMSNEERKFYKVRRIFDQLKKGKTPNANTIIKFARKVETRILLYEVLKKYSKLELFPGELSTREKASESYLTNWLDSNDEYDIFPDEIRLFQIQEYEDAITVAIFQFKSNEPHEFAERGWTYGFVGYNTNDFEAYIKPIFIFSEFRDTLLTPHDILTRIKSE
jgi:hypothetical protein